MKKALIIFVVILVGLFVFLSSIDTGDYRMEKRLYRVGKKFQKIASDPSVVPVKEFESLLDQYRDVIQEFPSSPLTPKVYLQIARVYALQKDYAKVREVLREILARYPDDENLCAEALLATGNTYEAEKNGSDAVKTYKLIQDRYPFTSIGMNIPLYIANYYMRGNKASESAVALRQAVLFYKKIAEEKAGSRLAFNALRLLSAAYMAQQNWSAAIDTLGIVLREFSSEEYLSPGRINLIIKSINTIAVSKLDDYDRAIDIYRKFLKEHSDHPYGKVIRQTISALQLLKSKNMKMTIEEKKEKKADE